MQLKKILALLITLLLILTFSACGSKSVNDSGANTGAEETAPVKTEEPSSTPTEEPLPSVELIVFAAASMTDAMNGIATMYADVAPNVTFKFNFDSSGTLKTQIQEGADCDIFISASQKAMNQLDINADSAVNTEGLDFVVSDSRINLVSNFCVLAVPEGNPAGISSFEDVATEKVSLIALGNSDVPAGQYAQELFENIGIWDSIQDKITFASNVKEVTTQISEAAVDCGVIYGTDAIAAGLEWAAQAEAGMHSPIVYPAAAIKTSKNEAAAGAFLEYLKTDEVSSYLESLGFSIP